MDKNVQSETTQQMSVVDALRLLGGKIKIIICISLAVFIVTGAVVAVDTIFDARYGSEVTFYVTPSDNTTSLLPLLESESFAERLLLEENGLPKKEKCDASAYDAALKAIQAADEARKAKKEAKKLLDLLPTEVAIVEQKHAELQAEYNEITARLNTLYSSAETIVDAEHLAKIDEYEAQLAVIRAEKTEYDKNVYYPTLHKKREADEAYAKASDLVKTTRAEADALTEKVLAKWREDDSVRSQVAAIKSSISFNYVKYDQTVDKFDEHNQNDAFLVISISASDEELADLVLDRITSRTADYVVRNIERLNNTTDASCTLITPYVTNGNLDGSGLIKDTVLTALVAAVAAAAIICFIIIAARIIKNDDIEKKAKKSKKSGASEEAHAE